MINYYKKRAIFYANRLAIFRKGQGHFQARSSKKSLMSTTRAHTVDNLIQTL